MKSSFVDEIHKGTWFEARVEDLGYKIVITTPKLPGWRKVHKRIALREETPVLWITHIEHDPNNPCGAGFVSTTWEPST